MFRSMTTKTPQRHHYVTRRMRRRLGSEEDAGVAQGGASAPGEACSPLPGEGTHRMKRTLRTTVLTVGALIAALALALALRAGPAHADDTTPRVDLRVLVVSDGGPSTDAIAA